MIIFLTTLLILLCLVVVLLILIQRTSGGMGSALGGGAADQVLGAGSAAQLTKLTVWGILGFFILAVLLYVTYQGQVGEVETLQRTGVEMKSDPASPVDSTLPEVPVSPAPESTTRGLGMATHALCSRSRRSVFPLSKRLASLLSMHWCFSQSHLPHANLLHRSCFCRLLCLFPHCVSQ